MAVEPSLVSGTSPLGENVLPCTWANNSGSTRSSNDLRSVSFIHDNFYSSADQYSTFPCLCWRPNTNTTYAWWSWDKVRNYVTACGSAPSNLRLKKCVCVGIYAYNCLQWTAIQYVTLRGGFVAVPIYDTLGYDIVEHGFIGAEVKVLFVSH